MAQLQTGVQWTPQSAYGLTFGLFPEQFLPFLKVHDRATRIKLIQPYWLDSFRTQHVNCEGLALRYNTNH